MQFSFYFIRLLCNDCESLKNSISILLKGFQALEESSFNRIEMGFSLKKNSKLESNQWNFLVFIYWKCIGFECFYGNWSISYEEMEFN